MERKYLTEWKNFLTEEKSQFPETGQTYKYTGTIDVGLTKESGEFQFLLFRERGEPGTYHDGRTVESIWNIIFTQSNISSIVPRASGTCQVHAIHNEPGAFLFWILYDQSSLTDPDDGTFEVPNIQINGDIGSTDNNITKVE